MTVDDAVSRLRAGLARDAEIARAAAAQSPRWTDGYESGAWAGGYSDTLGEHTFGHIERHSPSRVLLQVEKLSELVSEAQFVLGKNDPGLTDAGMLAVSTLELLASIYSEDTTETEKP